MNCDPELLPRLIRGQGLEVQHFTFVLNKKELGFWMTRSFGWDPEPPKTGAGKFRMTNEGIQDDKDCDWGLGKILVREGGLEINSG